ncbi:UDP-N-acetylmuramate dehydrogenase [Patescibacteria group bacterium]|nr:MAG: UDP-N-acetylmuramate dehydrogenase [Patescibacteria group bacterium]
MHIREHVPFSTLTTFRTGGEARYVLELENANEIPDALKFAVSKNLPLIPIGCGSNLLAPDAELDAVLIRLQTSAITSEKEMSVLTLTVDAGVIWDDLVSYAVQSGGWGIENLSAIPGTVGAAVVQNIGAYGAALSESVTSVHVFDTKERMYKNLTKEECLFGYRTSIFKKEVDRYIAVSVTFSLSVLAIPNLKYRDLSVTFKDTPIPELSAIRDAVIKIRQGKFPPLDVYGTAGSFFLNPIIADSESSILAGTYPEMPLFPLPEGGVKIPLAWILDKALALKGMRHGHAFLWEQQPLVITTEEGAVTKDVIVLASQVSDIVFAKTGIKISPEVRFL